MDELKEEQQIAVAETARCGGTKKTRFRRVATKVFEQGYADAANRQRAGSSAGKAVYPGVSCRPPRHDPGSGTIFRMAEAQRMYAAR